VRERKAQRGRGCRTSGVVGGRRDRRAGRRDTGAEGVVVVQCASVEARSQWQLDGVREGGWRRCPAAAGCGGCRRYGSAMVAVELVGGESNDAPGQWDRDAEEKLQPCGSLDAAAGGGGFWR
jgi:hypothetical protein